MENITIKVYDNPPGVWGGITGTITDQTDLMAKFLARDNTTIYNPTADYHPATVKFTNDKTKGYQRSFPVTFETDNTYGNKDAPTTGDIPLSTTGAISNKLAIVYHQQAEAFEVVLNGFTRSAPDIGTPSTTELNIIYIAHTVPGFVEITYRGEADVYTDEQAQDAVGTILDTDYFSYVDGTPAITASAAMEARLALADTSIQSVSSLVAKATAQTDDINGMIETVTDKTYIICQKVSRAFTITETTTDAASGTCTATFYIDGVALGGTANSVSSTETSQAHSSANVAGVGTTVTMVTTSNSTCLDMTFTVKYTYTLS